MFLHFAKINCISIKIVHFSVLKKLAIKIAVYLTTENNEKCQNYNFTDLYVASSMTRIFVIVIFIATKKSEAIPNTKYLLHKLLHCNV